MKEQKNIFDYLKNENMILDKKYTNALEDECRKLNSKINKAIEFIKNGIDFKSLHFIRGKDEDMWKIILVDNIKEELLEILGDKEDE